MARILVATCGLKGIMFSSFGLVKRLENVGHEVTWASPVDNADWASANSIRFRQLPNFLEKSKRNRRLPKLARIASNYLRYRSRKKSSLANLRIEELKTFLRQGNFDLLICEMEIHEVVLAAHDINLKTCLLSQWFSVNESAGAPPLVSPSIPTSDSQYQTEWDQLKASNQKKEARRNFQTCFVSRKIALLQMANEIGFPTNHWIEFLWPQPFVYRDMNVISMVMEELEFPGTDKSYLTYVGPMVDDQRRLPHEFEFDMSVFREKRRCGQKIILVTVTSFGSGSDSPVQSLNRAARQHPDWEIIVAPTRETFDTLDRAPNLHLFSWIPQLAFLEIADLSVNHGGINTINECIHFGVPMVIYSGEQHDQNGCLARACFHGIARMGQSDQFELEISAALKDAELARKIKDLQTRYQRGRENQILEKRVNQLLQDN